MAKVVPIPKREKPEEAPLFSKEQSHIVAVEKLASFRRGKAWGVALGAVSTLIASLVLLTAYQALDAESDSAAITAAAVSQRADAVSAEMHSWLRKEP